MMLHAALAPEVEEQKRPWRLLLLYTLFRFAVLIVFFIYYWLNEQNVKAHPAYAQALVFYTGLAFFWTYVLRHRLLMPQTHTLIAGVLDLVLITLLISHVGNLESGLGVILNLSVAILSIIVPGRLAIFFAAIASLMVIGISVFEFLKGITHDSQVFFMAGIHGAGFFATALTAYYLASWVGAAENLAKKRSRELAGLQRLNEYIVERLQYGVIYVDMDKRIRVINSAAKRFFNFDNEKTLGSLEQLSQALSKKYEIYLQKAKYTSEPAQTLIETPYLRVHFFAASFALQTAVLIIIEDLTAIAQQAQQLKLASLGRFSASIAHELRNPLGVISHAVQLLGEDAPLPAEDNRLKELIVNNCNRMNEVIKNVLQISRRQQADPKSIELKSFITSFKNTFCQSHSCDIELKWPLESVPDIVFDRSQLEQVLVILCENALQHGREPDGQVHIIFSIVIGNSHGIFLTVSDRGPGIPKNARESIFDPFYTTIHTGTGMGLFIARDLCEINQARLSLASSDFGSCFEIHFNQGVEVSL